MQEKAREFLEPKLRTLYLDHVHIPLQKRGGKSRLDKYKEKGLGTNTFIGKEIKPLNEGQVLDWGYLIVLNFLYLKFREKFQLKDDEVNERVFVLQSKRSKNE